MIVSIVVILVSTGIFANNLKNAAKVDGEILSTHTEMYKDEDGGICITSSMSVTYYYYNGKHYISDV